MIADSFAIRCTGLPTVFQNAVDRSDGDVLAPSKSRCRSTPRDAVSNAHSAQRCSLAWQRGPPWGATITSAVELLSRWSCMELSNRIFDCKLPIHSPQRPLRVQRRSPLWPLLWCERHVVCNVPGKHLGRRAAEPAVLGAGDASAMCYRSIAELCGVLLTQTAWSMRRVRVPASYCIQWWEAIHWWLGCI